MIVWNLEMKTLIIILLCLASFCGLIFTQNDVRIPPSITTGPSRKSGSVFYRIDDSLTLNCEGTGVPTVTYEWNRNGIKLNQSHQNNQRGEDGTITIQNAAASDEGFYQCFAINQYGTALSNTAHIQRAFLDSASGTPTTLQKTVQEGMPFHIQADRLKSLPKPIYGWEMATNTLDKNQLPLRASRRVQIAENGDLHFAYALPEDGLGGRIYNCTTYNHVLDVKAGGSYTNLTVTRNPAGNISEFAPTLGFASETQTVAVIGGRVTLRCFFYGYPEPTISWSGPRNTLPIGYTQNSFKTELIINDITASDVGDYICIASNTQGNNTHTLQIRVEAVPKFKNTKDGPCNVNATEGESVTFNCNPFAIPEANITWLQNGKPIDTDNPPERFVFSNNNKNLTIRDVCRDCVDQERKTDLMVIQCNASNVHGYAFASGYLNVLMKTKVTIRGSINVSVDLLEQKHFIFQCIATSDPSTPATVRWYKTEPHGDLVRDELPYVFVHEEFLIIMVYPNCSSDCAKYLGEYRCVADNGYSREYRTIVLSYQYRPPQEQVIQKEEPWSLWKITVGAGAIGLILFVIGMFLGSRAKRPSGTINGRTKDRKLPNPPGKYDRADYGIPLEGLRNNGRSMRRACSMYEKIGHDQVLEQVRSREGPTLHPPDVHRFISYDTIDTPQIEAINRGRRMLDEDTKYDDMRYTIPQEEVVNRDKIDQNDVNCYESIRSEAEKFQNSNQQSGEVNTYSNLSRKEVNSYLDLCSKEVDPYVNVGQKEVDPYVNVGQKEVNPYLNMGQKEMDPNLYMSPDSMSPPASTALREADDLVLKNYTVV